MSENWKPEKNSSGYYNILSANRNPQITKKVYRGIESDSFMYHLMSRYKKTDLKNLDRIFHHDRLESRFQPHNQVPNSIATTHNQNFVLIHIYVFFYAVFRTPGWELAALNPRTSLYRNSLHVLVHSHSCIIRARIRFCVVIFCTYTMTLKRPLMCQRFQNGGGGVCARAVVLVWFFLGWFFMFENFVWNFGCFIDMMLCFTVTFRI